MIQRRGRRLSQLTILSKSFRNPRTGESFKPKYFTDECSRKFVRYVLKEPSFDADLATVRAEYTQIVQSLGKPSSNKRADTLRDLLRISGPVVENLYMRILDNFDWKNQLEKALQIEYCGEGSRSEDIDLILMLICKYIGPADLNLQSRGHGEGINHEMGDLLEFGDLGPLDEIEPNVFRQIETENNRTFSDYFNIGSNEIDFDADYQNIDRSDTRIETLDESTDYY